MARSRAASPGTRRCSGATSSRRRWSEIAPVALRYGATDYARLPQPRRPLQVPADRHVRGQARTSSATGTGPSSVVWRADYSSWYQVPVLYTWNDLGRRRQRPSSSSARQTHAAPNGDARLVSPARAGPSSAPRRAAAPSRARPAPSSRSRRSPGRGCGSRRRSRSPARRVTPGRCARACAATWSNVLWSSLRTITRQLPPSPEPGPRVARELDRLGHRSRGYPRLPASS